MRVSANQKKGLLAVAAIAILLMAFSSLSILPDSGSGGLPVYARGEAVHWTVALNPQDGIPLLSSLGCSNEAGYIPVTIQVATRLVCNGDFVGGTTLYAPSSSCNIFSGTSAPIDFIGEGVATIPSSATSCYIDALFTANKNSAPSILKQREDTTNTGNIILQELPVCTTGQRMCSGSNPKVCTNNQWQQSEICQTGCTNGYCNSVCTSGQMQCYGNGAYQTCTSGGAWGTIIALSGSLYCQNNQIVKLCADGSYIAQTATCPGASGTKTCPGGQVIPVADTCPATTKTCPGGQTIPVADTCPVWCGNDICDGSDNSQNCLQDCPLICEMGNVSINNQCVCPPPLAIQSDGICREANGTDECPVYAAVMCTPPLVSKTIIDENGCSISSCLDTNTTVCNKNKVCEPKLGEGTKCEDCAGLQLDNNTILMMLGGIVVVVAGYFVVSKKKK